MTRTPMSTLVGYKDGSPLTTAQLDAMAALLALESEVGSIQTGLQAGTQVFAPATGTGDAMAVTLTPVFNTPVDGTEIRVRAPAANTISAPTLSLSGGSAVAITKFGGVPLAPAEYIANQELVLRYVASAPRWEFVNASETLNLATIAALRATSGWQDVTATVREYNSGTSSGGGIFDWYAASTDADDGIITFSTGAAMGRWKRRNDGQYVDIRWAGAVGDYNTTSGTDDTAAVQAWLTYLANTGRTGWIPSQWFLVNGPLSVTVSQYVTTLQIVGEGVNKTNIPIPSAKDARIVFGDLLDSQVGITINTNPAGTTNFQQVRLENFGISTTNLGKGIGTGLFVQGISLFTHNFLAVYFDTNVQCRGNDKMVHIDPYFALGKTCNLYLDSFTHSGQTPSTGPVFESLFVGGFLGTGGTLYYGGSTPYTGCAIKIEGAQNIRFIRTNYSSCPIGCSIDGGANITLDECYSEQCNDGTGFYTSVKAGITTPVVNLTMRNCAAQNEPIRLDQVTGGYIDGAHAPVLTTANTVGVRVKSAPFDPNGPFFPFNSQAVATGAFQQINFARDGLMIHQANVGATLFALQSGSFTTSFPTTTGRLPGRPYQRITNTGTSTAYYPCNLGQHSIFAGMEVFFDVTYRCSAAGNGSLNVLWTGVDVNGNPVSVVTSATEQLTSLVWTTASMRLVVPNTGGLYLLTKVQLLFSFYNSFTFDVDSIYVGMHAEPVASSPSDTSLVIQVTTSSGSPATLAGINPTGYAFSCSPTTNATAWAATVGSTVQIQTTSSSAITVNVVCTPLSASSNGY